MNNLLYATAVILVTAWMIGVFIYMLGAFVHTLLILALILILFLSRRERKAGSV